jgi:hypothetical protein
LVNEETANITNLTSFQQRNFVNFNLAANQGNYLIITHPVLTVGSAGVNPIDNYKSYRSSAAGGGYNAKIYMIDELVDQFAWALKRILLLSEILSFGPEAISAQHLLKMSYLLVKEQRIPNTGEVKVILILKNFV